MRSVFRLLGLTVASFFIVVFATATYSFIKKVWFGGGHKTTAHAGPSHVTVLDVSGVMMSATQTLRQLDDALEDSNTKAIVVRMNSPGGLVAPSQEMYEAFKRADKKVPVIITMGSVAASGGYYASLGGRKIYANPGTLTASIGVIMEFMNLEKLYQWAKVERFAMTAGKLKSAGAEFRAMTPEEKEFFHGLLENVHGQFKAAVKERRKLTDEEVAHWCDGRVMSGQQAKEAKLVDTLGTFDDAVRDAKKIAGLPDTAEVDYPEEKGGLLKKLLLGDTDSESRLGRWLGLVAENVIPASATPGWRVLLLSPVQ